jgi:hypothetical protein
LQSARVGSPRAQQHGGVRVCMAPRQQPEHSSTAARASAAAERPWRHVNSQSTTARRRALLQERPWQPGHSSTAACASVGRHVNSQSKTAPRGLGLLSQGAPRGPRATLALPVALGGWVFFAVLCASRGRRCAAQRPLGILGPFWACLAAPRAAWLAPPHERRCNSALVGSSAERIFFYGWVGPI